MNKINGIYIEFEPISTEEWSAFRLDLTGICRDHDIGLIRWETSLVTVHTKTEEQSDLFESYE